MKITRFDNSKDMGKQLKQLLNEKEAIQICNDYYA